MKGLFTKITALLLVVWYSMSIIGFDVHTCSGSGESFVVTFVEGFECEDIHPEHHCHQGSCCSHSHDCCETKAHVQVKSKSCCSSDYQVLTLTGTVSDEKNGVENPSSSVYCCCICSNIFELNADVHNPQNIFHNPTYGSSQGKVPDVQSVLSVWRI